MRSLVLAFQTFELDLAAGTLRRDGRLAPLRPKAWDVLVYLASRPGVLVTTDELYDAVWSHTAVTPNTMTNVIGELRRALGDDGASPRVIETVRRRGYRFIAELRTQPVAIHEPPVRSEFVGRGSELATLRSAVGRAATGARQVVFLNGEPGIGKTTLVDELVGALPAQSFLRVHCADGADDAYTPVLHLLEQWARSDQHRVLAALRKFAPAWLSQLPWLLDSAEAARLARDLLGAGPARMLREGAVLLEELGRTRPMTLIIEDVHWADAATMDLLATMLQRSAPTGLMLVVTYRPIDALVHAHPISALVARHRRTQGVQVLALSAFTLEEVQLCLEREFGDAALAQRLALPVGHHTGGNPLFVKAVSEQLRREAWVRWENDRWHLAADLEGFAPRLPDDLRELLELQIGGLPQETTSVLEAAAVIGTDVRAATVADVLGWDAALAEDVLHALAQRSTYLRPAPPPPAAAGASAETYRFAHALYQCAFRDRISPSRRRELHRRAGWSLESAHGTAAPEHAIRIAGHFEAAGELDAAARHREQAARVALGRFAYAEGVRELEQSIAHLDRCPQAADREERLARMHLWVGNGRLRLHGYRDPSVVDAFERAELHAARAGDGDLQVRALMGMGTLRTTLGDPRGAVPLVERQMALVRSGRSGLGQCVYMRAGYVRLLLGEPGPALRDLERALAEPHVPGTPVLIDSVAESHAWRTLALVQIGDLDAAWSAAELCLQRGEETGLPWGRSTTLYLLVEAAVLARDLTRAARWAEEAAECQRVHDLQPHAPVTRILGQYVVGLEKGPAAALAQLKHEMAQHERSGERWHHSVHLLLLADMQARAGDADAHRTLDAAFEHEEVGGDRRVHAELWRVRGEYFSSAGNDAEAEDCLRRAIAAARDSDSRLFELRAGVSLARVLGRQGRAAEALECLAQAATRCSNARGGYDFDEAARMLAELAAAPDRRPAATAP